MLTGMTSEPEQQIGVGTPDAFQRLWTPHRMAYIQGESKPSGPGAGDGCPFCEIPSKSDEDGLIVARGEQVYAVLNLYPYNGGHLMVVPYRHVADYTELDGPETAELADFTKRAMVALRAASGAHGFNIGMNQGRRRAPASPPTSTSTWCPAGAGTPTSCRSSDTRRCSRSCWATPGRCWPACGRPSCRPPERAFAPDGVRRRRRRPSSGRGPGPCR